MKISWWLILLLLTCSILSIPDRTNADVRIPGEPYVPHHRPYLIHRASPKPVPSPSPKPKKKPASKQGLKPSHKSKASTKVKGKASTTTPHKTQPTQSYNEQPSHTQEMSSLAPAEESKGAGIRTSIAGFALTIAFACGGFVLLRRDQRRNAP